ncbi:formimidoylglutamate deiminase [Abyssalbus ytuae]|uniref:Formimidoylglutamate deiminase n=1 Tax=Abyssalbus ytuae TaxID=2926907 RepID=A0A9E6ZN45_9FLAO|nr:formimidoylglutamate deiminase [Abyssalbus ytuae]UOB17749.1 formimidoylglutamate deiminase [Abyssalbus ytuae]
MVYKFKGLLQNRGWIENAYVTVDGRGKITDISTHNKEGVQEINGYAIPGFQNAHSHAFQYAMAGLAERHEGSLNPDDFWSWREAMYNLALSINPDQMEAIATMLYAEMLRYGYTNVAEFHYVHHGRSGNTYDNPAEMGARLIAAAKNAGIGITLIPIFYQKGGFGKDPSAKQRRFISKTTEDYYKLLKSSQKACTYYEHANTGIGIHSLRGVEPSDVVEVSENGQKDIPFHIHISEQLKEVNDSVEYLGQRPVEWLLDHINLNDRFHLVHATHLTRQETCGIAACKANVVLCPSTEGNLGDGLFPLKKYQDDGGKWSIGTDSHIGLNPFEELRILDYGQRLTTHKRNSFFSEKENDSGTYALEMATLTGRKAMNNFTTEYFKTGEPFNACIIDADSPLVSASTLKNLNSTLVYTADSGMLLGTISQGKMMVENNIHQYKDSIRKKFTEAIKSLNSR